MIDKPWFWYPAHVVQIAFWLLALWLLFSGHRGHWVVSLAATMMINHIIQVPVVFRLLRSREPSASRVVPMTLLFGLTWIVPARRGVFPAH
ncbi:MAG: hypothetical protein OSA97_01680 [Nevskia sp.]|nr:hypothetical protein [Nevskia sp.]